MDNALIIKYAQRFLLYINKSLKGRKFVTELAKATLLGSKPACSDRMGTYMKSYFKIFNFISDKNLKATLILDYKEVLTCIKRQAYKAAVVLAGGIVEAVLIDKALALPKEKRILIEKKYKGLTGRKKEIVQMELASLIESLKELKIITSPQAGRSDILRDYRNLIHPYKKGDRPTKLDAVSVKKLLDDLIIQFETVDVSNEQAKAKQFITHSAWKRKREQLEYREIIYKFIDNKGVVNYEDFLKLPSFKNKSNPSKALIANLTYLKQQGLCNFDTNSWRGYPIKRYETWVLNDGVENILKKFYKKNR